MEGDLDGLKLAMNKLVGSQKMGQTGVNAQSQDVKAWGLIGITCFRCHNKGHFQDNFPLMNKSGSSSVNEENPGTRSEPSTA